MNEVMKAYFKLLFPGKDMPPEHGKNARSEAALARVVEKFPEARAKIQQLFQQSPSFQSICQDYRDCLAAWHYWRQDVSEEAPALCQSYTELLQELDQEVREFLELESVPGSTPGKGQVTEYP
jgi:hypothetical protein